MTSYIIKSIQKQPFEVFFKGTLQQIWKSRYYFAFMKKQHPENFAFLILEILELFARKVCKCLKKDVNF